jgi:hypothetical protein
MQSQVCARQRREARGAKHETPACSRRSRAGRDMETKSNARHQISGAHQEHLKAILDLELSSGIVLRGCTWHPRRPRMDRFAGSIVDRQRPVDQVVSDRRDPGRNRTSEFPEAGARRCPRLHSTESRRGMSAPSLAARERRMRKDALRALLARRLSRHTSRSLDRPEQRRSRMPFLQRSITRDDKYICARQRASRTR